MYHRIADPGADPGELAVHPDQFAEQLAALRDRFTPLSLPALLSAADRGSIPPASVVVTFDDGYRDNLTAAKPLLERFDVPATIFVVSGYVDSGRPFWWDELERICAAQVSFPDRLDLEIAGRMRTWQVPPGRDRRGLFRELRHALGSLEESERDGVLAQLQAWAGVSPGDGGTCLTADELDRLGEGGLIEIGAHTISHPRLPALPRSRQREEIGGSVRRLEEVLGRRVASFSYPFGALNRASAAAARDAGLACACSALPGGVGASTDRFRLPRVYAGDWPADDLARHISAHLLDG